MKSLSDLEQKYDVKPNELINFLAVKKIGENYVSYKSMLSGFTEKFLPSQLMSDLITEISGFRDEVDAVASIAIEKDVPQTMGLMLKKNSDYYRSRTATIERVNSLLDSYATKIDLSVNIEECRDYINSAVNSMMNTLAVAKATAKGSQGIASASNAGNQDIAKAVGEIEINTGGE